MIKVEDLRQVAELIEGFKPRVTFYESNVLIPAVIDRLKYICTILKGFQELCRERDVAVQIDGALKSVLDPKLFELGVPEPKLGEQYLKSIDEICERDFIAPIEKLLEEYPPDKMKKEIEQAMNFLNAAVNCVQPFVGLKENLFYASFRTFLNIKERATGKVLLSPPVELSIILTPFQTRLDELENVVRTIIESVRNWSDQIAKQKTSHVETIVYLSQVKAAEEQARAARLSLYFQIAVIFFTISLVIGANRANLYIDKWDLENVATKLNGNLESCRDGKAGLESKLKLATDAEAANCIKAKSNKSKEKPQGKD